MSKFARAFIVLLFVSILVMITSINVSVADDTTCSISLISDLAFGSLSAGGLSSEKTVAITNDGESATTSLQISGQPWTSGSNSFDVSATHFSTTSGEEYSAMNQLSTIPFDLANLEPSSSETVYFRVMVPNNKEYGNYEQTITFTVTC